MKQLFFALFAVAFAACAAPDAYTIKGNVKGLEGKVYLTDLITYEQDTVLAENGRFVFEGTTPESKLAMLRAADGSFSENIFVEPGTLKITGDTADADKTVLSGTPTNEALNTYNQKQIALVEKYGEEPSAEGDAANRALVRETLEANYHNQLGVTLLVMNLAYDMPAAEVLAEIEKFSPELQQGSILTQLREGSEKRLATEPGNPYIDVVQETAAGQTVSLKSVVENAKNKYVLLDFWASWCRPCMEEVPYLLKDYAEYHPKGFEIYGVSLDKDREKWLAAVADNKMNWVQVSDLTGFQNMAVADYAVSGIPSNFLIDCATGKIVATNLRGEGLGEKLGELLGK